MAKRFGTVTIVKLFATFSAVFCLLLILIMHEFVRTFERSNNVETIQDFSKITVTFGNVILNNENDSLILSALKDTKDNNQNDDTLESWWIPFRGLITEKLMDINAPGEQSRGIVVNVSQLSEEEKFFYEKGFHDHGFNLYASDHISLQRSIEDPRNKECHRLTYNSSNYLDTSVIVIFYNEALSTLLRTAYSAVNRSPPHLLREVILVDDCSSHEELQEPLRRYIDKFLPKVRLLRTPKRLGLMNARLFGVNASSGMTYTFLDSHCECTEGWLEPLLEIVTNNYTRVAIPTINPIFSDTFQYKGYDGTNANVGGFDWSLHFEWIPPSTADYKRKKSLIEPFRSPTMAGCIFTIHKDFFKELGYYDPEFLLYGAENLEISFKIWMCGGTLEQIPCSHVGHMFRSSTPYLKANSKKSFETEMRNKARLAHVWMDNYKNYFYAFYQNTEVDYGDISERQQLRKNLQCNSFEWYLKNVYPRHYLPPRPITCGRIINRATGKCLVGVHDYLHPAEYLREFPIAAAKINFRTTNQLLAFDSEDFRLRLDLYCLILHNSILKFMHCERAEAQQRWKYEEYKWIHEETNQCLEIDNSNNQVMLRQCSDSNLQQWNTRRPKYAIE